MADKSRQYDILVFGATGFTGKHIAQELVQSKFDGCAGKDGLGNAFEDSGRGGVHGAMWNWPGSPGLGWVSCRSEASAQSDMGRTHAGCPEPVPASQAVHMLQGLARAFSGIQMSAGRDPHALSLPRALPSACRPWAIAGRDRARLDQVVRQLSIPAGSQAPGVVVADVTDQASLTRAAATSRVLLNAVGPFRQFGAPVIRACIDAGTHYLDVSGEPGELKRGVRREVGCVERKDEGWVGVWVAICTPALAHGLGCECTRSQTAG